MDFYFSINEKEEAENTIERSRFIAYLIPAKDKPEATAALEKVKVIHPKATHHCWAYKVGAPEKPEEYYSDDGEPSGTAGAPILQSIKKANLENVMLIIVRYFGGIKLGVRGLIDAYAETATLVLEKAKKIKMRQTVSLPFSISYSGYDTLRYKIEKLEGTIQNPTFKENIEAYAIVPKVNEKAAREIIENLQRS